MNRNPKAHVGTTKYLTNSQPPHPELQSRLAAFRKKYEAGLPFFDEEERILTREKPQRLACYTGVKVFRKGGWIE